MMDSQQNNRPVTLADVAKHAGVSQTTVSYVLSKRDVPISAEVRERVVRAAKELHYAKSAIVTAFQKGHSRTIGIHFDTQRGIFPDDPVANRVLAGVSEEAHRQGYHLLLYTGLPDYEEEATVEGFLDRRVDGLLVLTPPLESRLLRELAQSYLPCVALLAQPQAETVRRIPTIDLDNAAGMHLVVEHLVGLGHRRIGFIGQTGPISAVVARRTGYRHALSNFGIIYQEAWDFVEPDDGNYDVLFQRIEMMPDSPTAIVAAHDTQARRFMEAAARLGIAIPGRFSVTGTGGHWMTRETERLTTVLNHYERVGQAGIKALLRQIAGEDPATLHELIPVELVVRETTGPPFV